MGQKIDGQTNSGTWDESETKYDEDAQMVTIVVSCYMHFWLLLFPQPQSHFISVTQLQNMFPQSTSRAGGQPQSSWIQMYRAVFMIYCDEYFNSPTHHIYIYIYIYPAIWEGFTAVDHYLCPVLVNFFSHEYQFLRFRQRQRNVLCRSNSDVCCRRI